jgi:hypothetical protein
MLQRIYLSFSLWSKNLFIFFLYDQLIVESDSKILIDIVTNNYKFSGVVPTLVQRIQNLLALDWRVQFRHTWREGNRCVDWLANFSLSLDSFVCARMETPPSELYKLMFDDIFGVCMPRNVRLISYFFFVSCWASALLEKSGSDMNLQDFR